MGKVIKINFGEQGG